MAVKDIRVIVFDVHNIITKLSARILVWPLGELTNEAGMISQGQILRIQYPVRLRPSPIPWMDNASSYQKHKSRLCLPNLEPVHPLLDMWTEGDKNRQKIGRLVDRHIMKASPNETAPQEHVTHESHLIVNYCFSVFNCTLET